MKNKLHSTEEIILILRQGDGGQTVKSVCRENNISEASFFRWRKKSGDMDLTGAKRLQRVGKRKRRVEENWPSPC